jgi:hypothetical protein
MSEIYKKLPSEMRYKILKYYYEMYVLSSIPKVIDDYYVYKNRNYLLTCVRKDGYCVTYNSIYVSMEIRNNNFRK